MGIFVLAGIWQSSVTHPNYLRSGTGNYRVGSGWQDTIIPLWRNIVHMTCSESVTGLLSADHTARRATELDQRLRRDSSCIWGTREITMDSQSGDSDGQREGICTILHSSASSPLLHGNTAWGICKGIQSHSNASMKTLSKRYSWAPMPISGYSACGYNWRNVLVMSILFLMELL